MTNVDEMSHPVSKFWRYTSLKLDVAAFLLAGEDPEGEHVGKHYPDLPMRVREWVDVLNNAIRGGGLQAKIVYVTRSGAKEQVRSNELGRNEYVDWDTEIAVAELKRWCEANGHERPWANSQQRDNSAHSKPSKLRSDREDNLLRVIAALWTLSGLPEEHNTVADKLSAVMDGWGWEKPSKSTIADTILKTAAKLRPSIRN